MDSTGVVVVGDERRDGASVGGLSVRRWVAVRDVDEVAHVADPRAEVVFVRLADLVAGICAGQLDGARWQDLRVRVLDAAGTDVAALLRDLAGWQRHRRRGRVVAGIVLSAAALVAAWVLVGLGGTVTN